MKNLTKTTLAFLALNGIIGVGVIVAIIFGQDIKSTNSKIERDKSENFKFISPILDCEYVGQDNFNVLSYKDLHEKSEALALENNLSDYSVYFRDLNNGQWAGVNEKALFSPASLMKTPVLISFLRAVEREPGLIHKKVKATQDDFNYSIKQNFDPKTKIIKDEVYTLEEAARLMITESDNMATILLSKYVNRSDYEDLLKSVGVVAEENNQDVDIRVNDFAGFFRVLYNASYLNQNSSESALRLLARSTFNLGLVAGLPKEVVVAHKFGERVLEGIDELGHKVKEEKQLHDCGIVYADPNPYILCVMTKGGDFEKQEKFISGISKYVYSQVVK